MLLKNPQVKKQCGSNPVEPESKENDRIYMTTKVPNNIDTGEMRREIAR